MLVQYVRASYYFSGFWYEELVLSKYLNSTFNGIRVWFSDRLGLHELLLVIDLMLTVIHYT